MSGIVDKLKALLEPQPVPVEDRSWPDQQDPDYWVDDSIATYELPPVVQTGWAPTDDKQMPGYRGVEEHGVAFDSTQQYLIPLPQDVADANEEQEAKEAAAAAVDVMEEHIIQPIPVDVISMPEPIGRQNRVAINSFLVPISGEAVRIAPASHTREDLKLTVLNTDVVYVHTDAQAVKITGYPVTSGNSEVVLKTTDAVYAYALTGTPTVYVLETHSVEVDEHVK